MLCNCKSTAIQCTVILFNDVTCKSHKQRLIAKEHIAMHTNLIPLFKLALYSSTLVIKCLKVVLNQNSYCNTIDQSCFFKLCNPHGTPTFKTEVVCLVSNVQLVGFQHVMNSKYSVTLLFFGSNLRQK